MHQTYEILRYSPSIDEKKQSNNTAADDVDEQNFDEITSTGSFLSDLSDVSATDDDFLGTIENVHQNKSMSMEFNAIFGTPHAEKSDKKMAVPSQPFNENPLEKTFMIKNSSPTKNLISDDRKNRLKVPSPLAISKKFLHLSDNFTISKLCDTKGKRSFNSMQSCDSECNPIYEQIYGDDDDRRGGAFRLKNNLKNIEPKNDGIAVTPTNSKLETLINAQDCQHTFSYRTASRSVTCFLCSKK